MSARRTAILDAARTVIARSGVRGLRVEAVAEAAGVSVALIYYHFTDRTTLLRETLRHVNEHAWHYTAGKVAVDADPVRRLRELLLLELPGSATGESNSVRETSIAWGELRASAVFGEELRADLREATDIWVAEIAEAVRDARRASAAEPDAAEPGAAEPDAADRAAAHRLTALVEGVSARWLSGSLTLNQAHDVLLGAVALELSVSR